MVRFIAPASFLALASALLVHALPQPGVYSISNPQNWSLTLGEKNGGAFISAYHDDPSAEQWILESGSVFGLFSLKNSKFGSYLGFEKAESQSRVLGKDTPTEYMLFSGNKPDEFFIVTKERQDGARLIVDESALRGTRPGLESDVVLQLQGNGETPLTFKQVRSG